jgi:phosphoribosyl 1,2-cyclic phosphodiesterase
MLVTIYGARGSFPSAQPSMMRYGGNTTCVALQLLDGTHLFFEAGTGLRNYGKDLLRGGLPARVHFLLSHLHHDHVFGMPFFEPVYRPDFELVVHRVHSRAEPPFNPIPRIFDGVQTPVPVDELPCRVTLADDAASGPVIGSARVRRIGLNHPGGCTGFRVDDADGASFTFFTDNELHPPGTPVSTFEEQAEFARGTGALFQDAQYLDDEIGRHLGWGHSSLSQALEMGKAAGTSMLLLTHHDPDRSDDALDDMGARAAAWARRELQGDALLAYEGMRLEITGSGCRKLVDRWDQRSSV